MSYFLNILLTSATEFTNAIYYQSQIFSKFCTKISQNSTKMHAQNHHNMIFTISRVTCQYKFNADSMHNYQSMQSHVNNASQNRYQHGIKKILTSIINQMSSISVLSPSFFLEKTCFQCPLVTVNPSCGVSPCLVKLVDNLVDRSTVYGSFKLTAHSTWFTVAWYVQMVHS